MNNPTGFQPSFRISHRVTAALTRSERARGFLDVAKLSEDWLATKGSGRFGDQCGFSNLGNVPAPTFGGARLP